MGTSEGTSNRTWKGTCCQAQVRSSPGLVQYRLKFNSFELDSEVGRLVDDDNAHDHGGGDNNDHDGDDHGGDITRCWMW